jgi:hypothetical protein
MCQQQLLLLHCWLLLQLHLTGLLSVVAHLSALLLLPCLCCVAASA